MASLAVVCFFVGFSTCFSAKIVMLPMFGNSHYLVFAKLGEELDRRGHEVTIFVGDHLNYAKESHPFVTVFNMTLLQLIDTQMLMDSPSYQKLLLWLFTQQQIYCDNFLSDEKAMKKLQTAQILVGDSYFPCATLVAAKFDIPHVSIIMNSLKSPILGLNSLIPTYPSYVPQMFAGISPNMGLLDRIKNFWLYISRCFLLEIGSRVFYSEVKRKHNIKPDEDIWKTLRKVDLVLLEKDLVLENVIPIPPYVKEVGSFLPGPAKPLQLEWEEFMSSSGDDGVILVAFGSMVDTLENRIAATMNEAFSRLRMKVIWRLNTDQYDGKIASNIKTSRWLPQNDILGHPKTKLFITHGGANGLAEAVYHGVPMICSPFFSDQFDNARTIEYIGLGEILSVKTATVGQLVEMVIKIVADKRYKEKALQISKVIRMRPRTPVQEAAELIEYLHAVGNLAHLKPKGLELPFYQLYMLDVLLVLVVVLTLVLLIVVAVVKRVINVCCGASKKGKTS